MKNFIVFTMAITCLSIFNACEKDELSINIEEQRFTTQTTFSVADKMLSFNSGQDVQSVITALLEKKDESSELKEELKNTLYTPLYKEMTNLKSGNIDIYTVQGYDTLVPNPDFARLLNIDGEIMVNKLIYKISPYGTYYFPMEKKARFYEIYNKKENNLKSANGQDELLGHPVGTNTYLIEEGIYRYDTYAQNTQVKYVQISGNGEAKYGSYGAGSLLSTEPNYNSFKTFRTVHRRGSEKLLKVCLGETRENLSNSIHVEELKLTFITMTMCFTRRVEQRRDFKKKIG